MSQISPEIDPIEPYSKQKNLFYFLPKPLTLVDAFTANRFALYAVSRLATPIASAMTKFVDKAVLKYYEAEI